MVRREGRGREAPFRRRRCFSMPLGGAVHAPRCRFVPRRRSMRGASAWLGRADDAFGEQFVDLVFLQAGLAENFSGVLAEGRRGMTQARLRAVEPDRRGDTLVPVLL